ncbi:LOW QUALITY PROTEIN: uncharacterized protein ACIQIH_014765 [Cyanocitta cristata]
MAPLAHTLALLAMTVATAAIEVVPLDMAQNSFDDQYQGCRPAMLAALPALNRSVQQNKNFAQAWAKATAEWQKKMSSVSYLPSDQAIALMAYTMDDLHEEFKAAVREAGSSPREYRDNFHFKMLHFLLSSALAGLRDIQGRQCRCVIQGVSGVRFEAQPRDSVRLGRFLPVSHCGGTDDDGMDTVLQVDTCHSVDVRDFSSDPSKEQVLIQPFETFKVTFVVRDGDKVQHPQLHRDPQQLHLRVAARAPLPSLSLPHAPMTLLFFHPCHFGVGGHRGHHDHEGHQDPQRNEATTAVKATLATVVTVTTESTVATAATMATLAPMTTVATLGIGTTEVITITVVTMAIVAAVVTVTIEATVASVVTKVTVATTAAVTTVVTVTIEATVASVVTKVTVATTAAVATMVTVTVRSHPPKGTGAALWPSPELREGAGP